VSFWAVMNWIAWGLCAVLFLWIANDFIKVEKERYAEKKDNQ
jgi:hypothetical protein